MMEINGIEAGLLTVWLVGVIAALLGGGRSGFGIRAWLALIAAIIVPVLGSLLAVLFAGQVFARERRARTGSTVTQNGASA